MNKVLIIGIGNTLRRDDAIGVVTAERLGETMQGPHVEILIRQQLTPELAQDISEADKVIMIDADQGKTPGEVNERRITPNEGQVFTHELDAATLLACSRELYGKCPETFLITVTGESFDFGDRLSPAAAEALPEVICRAMRLAH
jgi:hydrogenase maturation protease